jgi:hypothetical protein
VFFATPVMRTVVRMLFPSTRDATTLARLAAVSLFMRCNCLLELFKRQASFAFQRTF